MFNLTKTCRLTVVGALASFGLFATAETNTYKGGQWGDWHTDSNWSLGHVPTADDDVVIGQRWIKASQSIVAKSLTYTAENKGDGKQYAGLRLCSTFQPGSEKILDSTNRTPVSITVSGDMTLSNVQLTICAGELSDVGLLADQQTETGMRTAIEALWKERNLVSVGGNLTIDGISLVEPQPALLTGTPVVFEVCGDFTLGESAVIRAVKCGWTWFAGEIATAPAGAKPRQKESGVESTLWTLAFGTARSYKIGAAYGGVGGCGYSSGQRGLWNDYGPYGTTYGASFGPFLPGSPSAVYYDNDVNGTTGVGNANYRSAGSAVVHALGNVRVDGQIDVKGAGPNNSGASGGGIWLAGERVSVGPTAKLMASGSDVTGNLYAAGGGGRIAVSEGLDRLQLAACATNSLPESLIADPLLAEEADFDVSCGPTVGKTESAEPGTAVFVRSATAKIPLYVKVAGKGSVTVGSETFSTNATVYVTRGSTVTVEAVPEAGSRLISISSDLIAGGSTETSPTVFTAATPTVVETVFADGNLVRVWSGPAAGGDFHAAVNWTPSGVPSVSDELYVTNGVLTVSAPINAYSLVLAGNSKMTVTAPPLVGNSDLTNLVASAMTVRFVGRLAVEGSSVLTLANDPVTGNPVRIVAGSFELDASAKVTADGKGFDWYDWTAETDDPYKFGKNAGGNKQTRGPGAGYGYGTGGAYGGDSGSSSWGRAYGSPYAPVSPGSPNGADKNGNGTFPNAGGGTVWIQSRTMRIDGTVSAVGDATYSNGASSGGGIWLIANDFAAGDRALLTSEGGYLGYSHILGYGSGGRIALGLGLTDEQIAALAVGEMPEGVTAEDGIAFVATDVRGGLRALDNTYTEKRGVSGTVATVSGGGIRIVGSPFNCVGTTPAVGFCTVTGTVEKTFTAPTFSHTGGDYRKCTGYRAVNAAGEELSGAATSFTMTAGGESSVTWLWEEAANRVIIRKPEHATLAVDGVACAGDVDTYGLSEAVSVEVIPEDGYEFLHWNGKLPIGKAFENPLPVTETVNLTPVVRLWEAATTRQFQSNKKDFDDPSSWSPANIPGPEDTVKIVYGTCDASNAFRSAAVVIEGGSLRIGAFGDVNAEVVLAGDMRLSLFDTRPTTESSVTIGRNDWTGHARLSVSGNLELVSKDAATKRNQLTVYGGPVEGNYTHATGSSIIEVGGDFTVGFMSDYKLVSHPRTGGSVKAVVGGRFSVVDGGQVRADEVGYGWVDAKTPPLTVGVGYGSTYGGCYGGTNDFGTAFAHSYGFANAPVEPGAAGGWSGSSAPLGAGLVRVHAKAMTIDGLVTADAKRGSNATTGGSGGGIWLTSDAFEFGTNAVFSVKGGDANYGVKTVGSGGRIALGYRLTDAQIEALASTGDAPGLRSSWRRKDRAAFAALYPDVSIELDSGCYRHGSDSDPTPFEGTFYYIDGSPRGLVITFR